MIQKTCLEKKQPLYSIRINENQTKEADGLFDDYRVFAQSQEDSILKDISSRFNLNWTDG